MKIRDIQYETYNGVMETSQRALIILAAFCEIHLSHEEQRLFDFFAVFGEDIGLNRSLQKRISGRGNAYNFREETIIPSVLLLQDCGLATKNQDDNIKITKKGLSVVDQTKSAYATELKNVAKHMSDKYSENNKTNNIEKLTKNINNLLKEPLTRPEDNEKFEGLMQNYHRDVIRMESLNEFIAVIKLNSEKECDIDNVRLKKTWLKELERQVEMELAKLSKNIAELQRFQMEISTC